MRTVTDILTKARALLARPGGWLQGNVAGVRKAGPVALRIVAPSQPQANCFCVTGAMLRAAGADYFASDPVRGLLARKYGIPPEDADAGCRALPPAMVLLAKHLVAEYLAETDKAPEDFGVHPLLTSPHQRIEQEALRAAQVANDLLHPIRGKRVVLRALDAALAEARAA